VLRVAIAVLAITSVVVSATGGAVHAAAIPTVTIGVIAPVDGGLTDFGRGIRDSVLLAVKEANARNAVKGWNIEVQVLDDSSDPAKGKQAATAGFAARVVGPYNSGVALQAAPVLAAKGVALVSPSNTLTSLTVGDDPTHPKRQWKSYFRMVGQDVGQAKFLAARAKALGYRSVAVVSETKAVSKGLADEFATAFKRGGGQVLVQQVVPDNATTFTGFLAAAGPVKPDFVFFGGEYGVAAALRTAATAAGLSAPIMGGDGMNDPAFLAAAGAAAKGTYASTVGIPLARLTTGTAFLASYQAAGFTTRPSDYGPYAYDAANAVIDALAKALRGRSELPGGLRSTVVRNLAQTNRSGVTGKVAFDAYGDARNPSFTFYKVDGAPLVWTPVG
jgi:branched-chain amino acid transport system substrate-binding protein